MKEVNKFHSNKIQKNHQEQYQVFVSKHDHQGNLLRSEWVLLKDLTLKEMTEFWNFISSGPSIKKFSDRAAGLKRIETMLDTFEVPTDKPVQAHNKPERSMTEETKETKKPCRVIIEELFRDNNGFATKAEIAEACNCPEKNVSVKMSIMKNPKRVKEPLDWIYHKPSKTYYTEGSGFDVLAADEEAAKEKKEKAAEKRIAKKKARRKAKNEAAGVTDDSSNETLEDSDETEEPEDSEEDAE